MRCRIIQDSAEMRTPARLTETQGHVNTQLSSTEKSPPSPTEKVNTDGKDPQRSKCRATKSKKNVKVSTKVSTLKPRSGSLSPPGGNGHQGRPHLPAARTSLSWLLFPLTLLQNLGSPLGSTGPLLKADTLIHSFLSISPTSSLQMETSIYWNIPHRGPTGTSNHPSRSKPIQSLHISSSS